MATKQETLALSLNLSRKSPKKKRKKRSLRDLFARLAQLSLVLLKPVRKTA